MLLGASCAEQPPPLPPAPRRVPLPDVVVSQLTDLLTIVDLSWLVLLRPRRLATTEWLKPALGRVLADERLTVVAKTTGVDLRESPELAVAGYAGDVTLQLVRHQHDRATVERRFRDRLTSAISRSELGHQAVSLWGNIGRTSHGFVSVGVDVAGFQYGGDEQKGPGRVALRYALGTLADVPKVLDDASLAELHAALQRDGVPPIELLFPGPFEGDLARGARGLLGAATGVGVCVTTTAKQTLRLVALIGGDYSADLAKATSLLEAAWNDLAASDLGHLLGLHTPKIEAEVLSAPFGIGIGVELDADSLFRGLSAATVDHIEEIMR